MRLPKPKLKKRNHFNISCIQTYHTYSAAFLLRYSMAKFCGLYEARAVFLNPESPDSFESVEGSG